MSTTASGIQQKPDEPDESKESEQPERSVESRSITKEKLLDIIINVGGIQYTLNREKKGINYLFRSYSNFETTFKNVADRSKVPFDRIQQLFIKYMRVEPFRKQDFGAIPKNDKIDLKKIFEAYLQYLKNSKDSSGNSIVSIMIDRTYYNIKAILEALNGKPEDYSKMSESCTKSKEKLFKLDDDLKKLMILEFTWLLEHPEEIRTKNGCRWAEMVSELAGIRLDDMTSQISQNNAEDYDEKEADEKEADEPQKFNHSGGAMSSRIKALLTVLHVAKMSKKPFIQTGGGSATDDFHDILSKELSLALLPLFDYIKSMYQPVYGMLQSCMIHSHIKKRKILEPLLVLLHISNYFVGSRNESYGIYRIRNANKLLTPFITAQLQCSMTRINKMSAAKRKKCLESIHQLTPIHISSLPKRKAISSRKKTPPLPTVQYITLDGNLTIPPFERFYRKGSESEKESTFQAITDFFTKDDIYMAYSTSEEIPMNLYEIDYSAVDTMETHIPIDTHKSYFTSHSHELQQFVPLVENAIYTNAELVLSIFIALKEKRSK
jgi:hypothetical protein